MQKPSNVGYGVSTASTFPKSYWEHPRSTVCTRDTDPSIAFTFQRLLEACPCNHLNVPHFCLCKFPSGPIVGGTTATTSNKLLAAVCFIVAFYSSLWSSKVHALQKYVSRFGGHASRVRENNNMAIVRGPKLIRELCSSKYTTTRKPSKNQPVPFPSHLVFIR